MKISTQICIYKLKIMVDLPVWVDLMSVLDLAYRLEGNYSHCFCVCARQNIFERNIRVNLLIPYWLDRLFFKKKLANLRPCLRNPPPSNRLPLFSGQKRYRYKNKEINRWTKKCPNTWWWRFSGPRMLILQIFLIINMSNEQVYTNTILSNAKFRYVSLKRVWIRYPLAFFR